VSTTSGGGSAFFFEKSIVGIDNTDEFGFFAEGVVGTVTVASELVLFGVIATECGVTVTTELSGKPLSFCDAKIVPGGAFVSAGGAGVEHCTLSTLK
jgi:hypothetical protein